MIDYTLTPYWMLCRSVRVGRYIPSRVALGPLLNTIARRCGIVATYRAASLVASTTNDQIDARDGFPGLSVRPLWSDENYSVFRDDAS